MPARQCDVAVIGGGFAGVCAAASAAQAGAKTTLIDATQKLGGAVTAAMHRSLCGLYSHAPKNPLDTLNSGRQRELVQRMLQKDRDSLKPRQFGKSWVLEFSSPVCQASLADMVAETNVEQRLGCRATAVQREARRITAIQLSDSPNDWTEVKAVIDCTGYGNFLLLAGPDIAQPPVPDSQRMLGGFAIRWVGISDDPELLRLQIPWTLAQAVSQGLLPNAARFTTFYPGPGEGEGVCKLAITPEDFAAGRAESLADAVAQCLLKLPAFASASVKEKSPAALPRDGRRLRGKFTVTEDDILQARHHTEPAVHAWWPIERWDISAGPTYAYPPEGQHFDISPAALQSAELDNLLAAGACLSATQIAAASIRASGICLATGDLAGKLAASLL